jgi:hypothetical protein
VKEKASKKNKEKSEREDEEGELFFGREKKAENRIARLWLVIIIKWPQWKVVDNKNETRKFSVKRRKSFSRFSVLLSFRL